MARLSEKRAEHGYELIALHGDAVYRLRDRLEAIFGMPLAHYKPDEIVEKQVEVSKRVHKMGEWREILHDNAEALSAIVGPAPLYQREPYLRIARSQVAEDNIGIHRDTHYGATDAEWVLWIPLTHATDGAEMRIYPDSHKLSEAEVPWSYGAADCEKGSDKHWLGYRYAPKRMPAEVEEKAVPVPCRVGEALIFNSACVHGQTVNTAPWTRMSVDIRLVDESAPIERSRGMHGDLYEPLYTREAA